MVDRVQGSSVLIVDDDPQNLRLLTAVLGRGGLEPRPVTSGRLAIEAADDFEYVDPVVERYDNQ